jgi:hypothetical protein
MTGNSAIVRYLWSVYRGLMVSGVYHGDNGQLFKRMTGGRIYRLRCPLEIWPVKLIGKATKKLPPSHNEELTSSTPAC